MQHSLHYRVVGEFSCAHTVSCQFEGTVIVSFLEFRVSSKLFSIDKDVGNRSLKQKVFLGECMVRYDSKRLEFRNCDDNILTRPVMSAKALARHGPDGSSMMSRSRMKTSTSLNSSFASNSFAFLQCGHLKVLIQDYSIYIFKITEENSVNGITFSD